MINDDIFVLGNDEYSQLLRTAHINRAQALVFQIAQRVLKLRPRYDVVAGMLKCPWWIVAAIHYRESNSNFAGVLHNGEKIIGTNRKTRLVPVGRGPFSSWEESAVDAFKIEHADRIHTWSVEMSFGYIERYNGMGPRNHGIHSGYLWSFTNQYSRGKYVSDGIWNPSTIDQQIGCVALLLAWADLGVHLDGIMKVEAKAAA